MKLFWKLIIIFIVTGLILSTIGLVTGASRTLYWNRTGVIISSGEISHITSWDIGPIEDIYIDAGFSDVEFVISNHFGVELYSENAQWEWRTSDVLEITQKRNTVTQILSFDFTPVQRSYVKVYLPENAELGVVDVKTNSGNIMLGGFKADTVNIKSSFGDVDLNGITSSHLNVDLNSGRLSVVFINTGTFVYSNNFGDAIFKSVSADTFRANNNSGNLKLIYCTFGDTGITSRFGDITGNDFISSKTNINSNSGSVDLSGTLSGETVIHTGFGNTILTTSLEKELYSYDISVRFGNITFDSEYSGERSSLSSGSILENHLKLSSSSGDINVNFK